MIEVSDRELAADVEVTVRGVPGVTAIFRAGDVISKAVQVGAQAIGLSDSALVRVALAPDGARIEIAIGVDRAAGAVETSRRVQAAVEALCVSRVLTLVQVHITVVHIDETGRTDGGGERYGGAGESL